MKLVCRRDPEHRFAAPEESMAESGGEDEGEDEGESTALLLMLLFMVSGYEWRRMVGIGNGGGRAGMNSRGFAVFGASGRWILADGFFCRRLSG